MAKYSRDVAAEPCATDAFSWELAAKMQCRHGVSYPVEDEGMRTFFEPLVKAVLEAAHCL